jgi:hypothetical protein
MESKEEEWLYYLASPADPISVRTLDAMTFGNVDGRNPVCEEENEEKSVLRNEQDSFCFLFTFQVCKKMCGFRCRVWYSLL